MNWQRWGVRNIRELAGDIPIGSYVAVDCPQCGRLRLCREATRVRCDKCNWALSVRVPRVVENLDKDPERATPDQ